jgi:hypothetical protein
MNNNPLRLCFLAPGKLFKEDQADSIAGGEQFREIAPAISL